MIPVSPYFGGIKAPAENAAEEKKVTLKHHRSSNTRAEHAFVLRDTGQVPGQERKEKEVEKQTAERKALMTE